MCENERENNGKNVDIGRDRRACGPSAATRTPDRGPCGRHAVAAYVSARIARRMPARLALGAGCGDRFAARQFCFDVFDGRSHARADEAPLHGGGTCGFCGRFGRLCEKDRGKRLDGLSCRAPGAGMRQIDVFGTGGNFRQRFAPVCRRRMVSDPVRPSRHGPAGGYGALYRNGYPHSSCQGEKLI